MRKRSQHLAANAPHRLCHDDEPVEGHRHRPTSPGTGLFVMALAGDEISAMTRFENTVLPSFGLPR